MKITIDKTAKTVMIHEHTNIAEVMEFLKGAGIDLKEYTLISNTVFVTVKESVPQLTPFPVYPNYPVYPTSPLCPDWTYRPGIITY